MTQMENEPMLTDSLEERIERLEKRMKQIEAQDIKYDAEHRLLANISTLRYECNNWIADVEIKIDNHIQTNE